jgi:hypothetical protein
MKTLKPNDVDRIVEKLDETRVAEHWRNPDRPDARFVKKARSQPIEVVRAQGRIRSSHYRNKLDQRRAPTAYQVGMAMVCALVTSSPSELTEADKGILGRALADLQGRGFSIIEAKNMLRRLRNRLVDPPDREGEPTE